MMTQGHQENKEYDFSISYYVIEIITMELHGDVLIINQWLHHIFTAVETGDDNLLLLYNEISSS